jgi:multiple sugar transport system substrate-binding protein
MKANRINRATFAVLSIILIASMVLAACAQPATPSPAPVATEAPAEPAATEPPATTEVPAATEAPATTEAPVDTGGVPAACFKKFDGVTLNVMPVAEAYALAFRNYEEDMKDKLGVSFKYDFTTVPEAFNKIISDFALGTSAYDIVLFQPANLPDIYSYLEPIGPWSEANGVDFDKDNWEPRAWALYTQWNDTWVTMPWDVDIVYFVYNKTAFERPENQEKYKTAFGKDLKPPETWEEYAQLAQFFNDWDWAGDGRTHYGAAETWAAGWTWYMWQPRFGNYGGQYFDKDMKPLINQAAGVEALKNMVESQKGMIAGVNNFGYADQETAFAKGDVAMAFSWPSINKTAELGDQSTVKGQVGIDLLPGAMVDGNLNRVGSLEGGWSMGVPTYAENKDAALCVTWYLSQAAVHDANAAIPATALDSGTKSSFEPDSAVCSAFPTAADMCTISVESIARGFPEIYLHGRAEYMDALMYEIGQALTAGKDPQQAMDDAAKKWDEITDNIGRDQQIADWNSLLSGNMQYQPTP